MPDDVTRRLQILAEEPVEEKVIDVEGAGSALFTASTRARDEYRGHRWGEENEHGVWVENPQVPEVGVGMDARETAPIENPYSHGDGEGEPDSSTEGATVQYVPPLAARVVSDAIAYVEETETRRGPERIVMSGRCLREIQITDNETLFHERSDTPEHLFGLQLEIDNSLDPGQGYVRATTNEGNEFQAWFIPS